jgi:hypothetical protein
MIKTVPAKSTFGVPTLETASRIADADVCSQEFAAHYRYQTRMRELERQFEEKASEIRAAFVAEIARLVQSGE